MSQRRHSPRGPRGPWHKSLIYHIPPNSQAMSVQGNKTEKKKFHRNNRAFRTEGEKHSKVTMTCLGFNQGRRILGRKSWLGGRHGSEHTYPWEISRAVHMCVHVSVEGMCCGHMGLLYCSCHLVNRDLGTLLSLWPRGLWPVLV